MGLKKLTYSAQSNKKIPLKNGIYKIKGIKENFKNCLCISKNNKNNKYDLKFLKPNKKVSVDFEIKKHDEGYYSITPLFSKKAIEVKGISNMKWYVIPCGKETFHMISEKDLLAIGTYKQRKNSFGIKHFEVKNNPEQLFRFERVKQI